MAVPSVCGHQRYLDESGKLTCGLARKKAYRGQNAVLEVYRLPGQPRRPLSTHSCITTFRPCRSCVAIGHANLVRFGSDGRILDLIQQVSRLYWQIGRGVSYSRYESRNRRVDLIPRAYTLGFPFSSFYCLMGHARRGACQTILHRQGPLSESTSSMFRLLVRSQLRFDLYLC